MRNVVWAALAVAVCTATGWAVEKPAAAANPGPVAAAKEMKNPMITIKTSMGTIEAELWADKAPETVKNFKSYISDGHYDGLIFHRVIPGFMIQGGGFNPDMKQKGTKPPVKNEARKDVPNDRGTLAMARTMVVDSATSQFFINLKDNNFLNHKDKTPRGFGYCVFGKVTKGMDVVDSIAKVPTGKHGPHSDVPTKPVTIESVTVQE